VCGRFSLSGDVDFYAEYFGVDHVLTESLDRSWNVAPTDPVYVVAEREETRNLGKMRWGLIPHWAGSIGTLNINARIETAATTPAFRDSFTKKRCLIPADGFYEWEPAEKGRRAHWIFRADGFPVGFAGLWSAWRNPVTDEWIRSCTILTTSSTGVIAGIHNRMPVALVPEVWEAWLDRDMTGPEAVRSLIQPIPDDAWMEREVSSKVNSVKNNGPDLLDPPGQTRLL
jgi:putative SOS response-associated peptidase YedK